jgi:hypothetical protein
MAFKRRKPSHTTAFWGAASMKLEGIGHGLNMELDLQSLFGLHVHSRLAETPQPTPLPPAFGLIYEGAVGQPR